MNGTVLLADDNIEVRNVLARILKRFKFEVVTASDGPESVAIFRDDPDKFRLVMLDQCMPSNHDGIEAFIEIQKIRPDVIGVVLSGLGAPAVQAHCAELGAHPAAVIGKPFNLKELRIRLSDILGETI